MKGMPQGRRRNEELGKKLVDRTMRRCTGYVKRGADVLSTPMGMGAPPRAS
jgi:hypothetical protein